MTNYIAIHKTNGTSIELSANKRTMAYSELRGILSDKGFNGLVVSGEYKVFPIDYCHNCGHDTPQHKIDCINGLTQCLDCNLIYDVTVGQ